MYDYNHLGTKRSFKVTEVFKLRGVGCLGFDCGSCVVYGVFGLFGLFVFLSILLNSYYIQKQWIVNSLLLLYP